MNLLRKLKKQYFNNTNVSNVTDNKCSWKSVKPYFSNKGSHFNAITLVENNVIITNDKGISKTMNKFFRNTTKKLKLKPFKNSSDTGINQTTSAFKNHVSIRKIQGCFPNIEANDLNFWQVPLKKVKSEILNLNLKRSSTESFMPVTMLKQFVPFLTNAIYLPFLTNAENKNFFT